MSNDFTDICLSDTVTASSLCWGKVATDSQRESTRDSRITGRALPQRFRHGFLHPRQLKRFRKMGIARGS